MKKKKLQERLKIVETIVFSLLIVVVLIASLYGPAIIKMLPLLFILGICGNVFFGRPVVTTIFGIITSICIVHLKGKYGFFENIFISLSNGLSIALGEMAGQLIKKTYLYFKKHKKKYKKNEIITYVITIIFLLIVCPILHSYSKGSLFKYYSSKEKLKQYLAENYEDFNNFKIKDVQYIPGTNSNYLFKILYENSQYSFKVYTNDKLEIFDGYKQSILGKTNSKIRDEFKKFLVGKKLNMLYSNFNLKNNDLELVYNYSDENINKKIIEDLDLIYEFNYISNVDKIDIFIKDSENQKNDTTTSISVKDYEKCKSLDEKEDYIKKAFEVEYLDD